LGCIEYKQIKGVGIMKRNLLILVIILLIGFIVNSCGGDEENECSICNSGQHCYTHCVNENCPVHDCNNHNKNECTICNPLCNLGEHLGVGETCNGTNCTLKDYRTAAQKISFPKEIYRYSAEVNYPGTELRDTADKIVAAFEQIVVNANGEIAARDDILEKIGKLYVVKSSDTGNTGRYTWDGTDFGADPLISQARVEIWLERIGTGTLNNVDIAGDIIMQTAVLQSANNVRISKGKK
jgi:hypothetical protein